MPKDFIRGSSGVLSLAHIPIPNSGPLYTARKLGPLSPHMVTHLTFYL